MEAQTIGQQKYIKQEWENLIGFLWSQILKRRIDVTQWETQSCTDF